MRSIRFNASQRGHSSGKNRKQRKAYVRDLKEGGPYYGGGFRVTIDPIYRKRQSRESRHQFIECEFVTQIIAFDLGAI